MAQKNNKTPIPAPSLLPNFTFACIPVPRGCSCLHLSLSRLIAHAPQVNSQSSIVNNKYAKPLSCPPCPLCPCPLCFSTLCSFVPLCLCGCQSIMQNKPNFLNPQNHRNPLYSKELHQYSALRRPRKTNPIKPNSPDPLLIIRRERSCILRSLVQ
jgi:hypothetical protein